MNTCFKKFFHFQFTLIVSLLLWSDLLVSQEAQLIFQNGHSTDITAVAAANNEIASVDASGILLIWDANTRMIKSRAFIGNHPFAHLSQQKLSFEFDNKSVLFNTNKFLDFKYQTDYEHVKLFSFAKDSLLLKIPKEADVLYGDSVSFIFLNEFLASQNSSAPRLLRQAILMRQTSLTGEKKHLSFNKRITCFAKSPNNNYIAIGFEDGNLMLFDEGLNLIWENKDFEASINSIVFLPNNQYVVYSGKTGIYLESYPKKLMVRNISDGKKEKSESVKSEDAGIRKIVVSSDGKYLAASMGYYLAIWETQHFTIVREIKPSYLVPDVATFSAINDLCFSTKDNELLLVSQKSLLSYDIEQDLFSSNFNHDLSAEMSTQEIGFIDSNSIFLTNRKYGNFDLINLTNLTNAHYAMSYLSRMVSSNSNQTFRPPLMLGGNVFNFDPYNYEVQLWGTPRDEVFENNSNSFFCFDSRQWKLLAKTDPLIWNKEKQLKYRDFQAFDYRNDHLFFTGTIRAVDMNFWTTDLYVIHAKTGKEKMSLTLKYGNPVMFSPDKKYFAIMDDKKNLVVYSAGSLKEVYRENLDYQFVNQPFEFTPENDLVYISIKQIDADFHTKLIKVKMDGLVQDTLWSSLNMVPNTFHVYKNLLAMSFMMDYTVNPKTPEKADADFELNNNIVVFDLHDNRIIHQVSHIDNMVQDILINDKILVFKEYNQNFKIQRLGSNQIINLASEDNEHLFFTDNYYASAKKLVKHIGIKTTNGIFPVGLMDLTYNRPDLVLSALRFADSITIDSYHQAWLRRLKRMGFKEKDLKGELFLPESEIVNKTKLPATTSKTFVELDLSFRDSLHFLDRLFVRINNVPVGGSKGIDVRDLKVKSLTKKITAELAFGENRIQVSCLNQNGMESFKETVIISCTPDIVTKPNLYLITIGMSKHQDSSFNLIYPEKDAYDVSTSFANNWFYGKTLIKSIKNEDVTKENIDLLKLFLDSATINDVVIVFYAGHGVLDQNFDYYLASHNMNFSSPAINGIPYQQLEQLLDGIKPLKKILMIDACHSGEVDKDEMAIAEASNTGKEQGDIKFRNVGAGVQRKESLGLNSTSEMMKELFTDLRKGTGATVISSAGGGEYAMESDQWKNGLFTYCLLNGLQSREADLDGNGQIMLSELQQYVQNQVLELSRGQQKPTSRIENIEMDFRVW